MGKVVLEPERVVDLLDELTKLRRRLASAARKHDAETLLEALNSLEEWEDGLRTLLGDALWLPLRHGRREVGVWRSLHHADGWTDIRIRAAEPSAVPADALTRREAGRRPLIWLWSKLKKAGVAISVPEEGVIALHLAPGVNPDLDGLLGKVAWALSRLMADEASDPAPEAEPESGGKEGGRWFDG